MTRKGLLERLAEGPVIGDGSMCMTLEKRGYCRAGPYTPEAVILYPDAVRQLLREYLRAGADVLQAPCFYASDEMMERCDASSYKAVDVNDAACKMAKEVANEGDALVCGGLSPVQSYISGKGEAAVRKEFNRQLDVFITHDVDFVLAEFFGHLEEIEICIDVMKRAKKPIAATMRIGPAGDLNGVSIEECAVRMAKTGADMIGLNCMFDLDSVLKALRRMRTALDEQGLSTPLMCQPLGWRCPEAENELNGYLSLPEYPFALDPRVCTRAEVRNFTRSAYELGVRYIGGCCGMEPHHIRAIAHELQPERQKVPPVNDMCPPDGKFLTYSRVSNSAQKASKEYWKELKPGFGRPFNSSCSIPQESNFGE